MDTKPVKNADRTRRLLLTTAEQLFARLGFDAVSVDTIATRAGVNKRMIYVYFGSKEGLYRQVLAANFDKAMAKSGPWLKRQDTDVYQRAVAILRSYFYFLAENPRFVRLLAWESLRADRRTAAPLMDLAFSGLESIKDVLDQGVKQRVFRPGLDVRLFASTVNSLFLHFFQYKPLLGVMWGRDLTDSAELETVFNHNVEILFHGCMESQPCVEPSR